MVAASPEPTPRKIRAGVISAPPPMPVSPTTIPTTKPATRIERAVMVKMSIRGCSGFDERAVTAVRSSREMWSAAVRAASSPRR